MNKVSSFVYSMLLSLERESGDSRKGKFIIIKSSFNLTIKK